MYQNYVGPVKNQSQCQKQKAEKCPTKQMPTAKTQVHDQELSYNIAHLARRVGATLHKDVEGPLIDLRRNAEHTHTPQKR